jgi:hypothetical protein
MQNQFQFGQSNTIRHHNYTDDAGNPSGGYAHGPGLCVAFQDGPRGKNADGQLEPANGAFVEDLLAAAVQRLEFFQASKFAHPDNAAAIASITDAINSLNNRAKARADRGVLGSNTV